MMEAALRRLVWDRAGAVREYCRMPQEVDPLPFCVDHVIAQQHRGATEEANLARSCYNCNSHKGPNIAGLDPDGGALARLSIREWTCGRSTFNGTAALGALTRVGRATIDVLQINAPERVEHRRLLMEAGVFSG